jgi:mRNA interferase MazF
MATHIKGYPFEVLIAGDRPSAVLSDQVKSLDWRVRRAVPKGKVTAAELADIRGNAAALIGNDRTSSTPPPRS